MKIAHFVVAAIACLICAGCARQPGQPDPVSMAKEMTGEFGTFVADVKDEAVERVLDETAGLRGRP